MEFPAILFQVHILTPTPISQTMKTAFSGFIHFMKFLTILVQVYILTSPIPISQRVKNLF